MPSDLPAYITDHLEYWESKDWGPDRVEIDGMTVKLHFDRGEDHAE